MRAVFLRENLAIVAAEKDSGELAVFTCDARTGAAVPSRVTLVELATETRDGRVRRFTASRGAPTDEQGLAVFAHDPRFTRALAVARADDGRAAWALVHPRPLLRASEGAREHDREDRPLVSVAFERALLRPGEVVRARAVARRPVLGSARSLGVPAGESVEVA
ncbi:hypothetical protein HY251_05675, partial [bacterium]|nr:hypothetical protein [bacterium]